MAVFRVNKTKDYTTMSNYHLKDKNITLKAKGLLSVMLSLPEEWDYSIKGLQSILKDKETIIRTSLIELEQNNYLRRTKVRNTKGIITEWIYDIYENPHVENPQLENPQLEKPHVENQAQLNTNILSTKELNTKQLEKEIKRKLFIKPSLEEVTNYCKERNNNVNPQAWLDFYESKDWMIGKNKMKDWKAAIRVWESRDFSKNTKKELNPEWMNNQVNEVIDPDKEQEIINMLNKL